MIQQWWHHLWSFSLAGKTSSAHIIARECGYDVVEMNASDTRNKSDAKVSTGMGGKSSNVIKVKREEGREREEGTRRKGGREEEGEGGREGGLFLILHSHFPHTSRPLSHSLQEMTTNETLFSCMGVKSSATVVDAGGVRKQLLVMDEVDGMSGGDRGGIQDLISTIKRSKIPIICICNDKWNQKLKALRNYCLELDYRKPMANQVTKRMIDVCQKEGLRVNDVTMNALVEVSSTPD